MNNVIYIKRDICKVVSCLLILICGGLNTIIAQENDLKGEALINEYLKNGDIDAAENTLNKIIESHTNNNEVDSLYKYPYFVGKIARLKTDVNSAIETAVTFIDYIEAHTENQATLYRSKVSLSQFYDELDESQKSFDITAEALGHVLKASVTKDEVGKIRYNLGFSYLNLDDIPKAKIQFQEALLDYEAYPDTNKKWLSDGYNAMGAVMWLSSKLDSASYYYDKASITIENAPGNPIENLHFATVIKSNVSLLEHSQGNLSKAIKVQSEVIANFEEVIQNVEDQSMVQKAQRFQSRAISNMSIFYNEVGNLTRANEMLKYAYAKKKVFLEPTDSDIGATLIQMGQSEISLKSFDAAREYIEEGLAILQTKGDAMIYWKGVAYRALAEVYQSKEEIDSTALYYSKAMTALETALGENIDTEYLNLLKAKSQFEAKQNRATNAIITAQKAYDHVNTYMGDTSFEISKQMANLSAIYLQLERYDQSIYWSEKADDLLQQKIESATTVLDSVKLSFDRPKLTYLKMKSTYAQIENPSVDDISRILHSLNKATAILEHRKRIAITPEDVNLLLQEYQRINEFAKLLHVKRYNLTQDRQDLNALMSIQESGVYNKIRSKLNYQNVVAFSGVPSEIIAREKELKNRLSEALSHTADKSMAIYFNAETKWNDFQDSIRASYPDYYRMRYETIETSVDQILNTIPPDVTIIRYFFVEDILYVFVANENEQTLTPLDFKNSALISRIIQEQFQEDEVLQALQILANDLWSPIASKITTEHIVIIPDKALFNLSFELLPTQKVSSYSDLATHSVLAHHTLSYTYSLSLVTNQNTKELTSNFIAFTPEFSDDMKEAYKITIVDSLQVDQTYLRLLPQPFSVNTASRYTKTFDGEHFKNKNATKQIFKNQAGEHKIIHIGTHAESNNVSPELSRLIFAKNISENQDHDSNSLYAYEIYNCNLTSNLAILTACETGKPTYQSGEGMISLAHAFNYAGSESILTSLWKIDEQSSAQIVSYFYDHLKEGMAKDKALRSAKLAYLATAEGRTLQPNYWAGLVLIGDTTPMTLSKNGIPLWLWILLCSVSVLVLLWIVRNKTKK